MGGPWCPFKDPCVNLAAASAVTVSTPTAAVISSTVHKDDVLRRRPSAWQLIPTLFVGQRWVMRLGRVLTTNSRWEALPFPNEIVSRSAISRRPESRSETAVGD